MNSSFKTLLLLLFVVGVSWGVLVAQGQKKTPIVYPMGYRHWTLVKSMVIFGNQHPLSNQFGGLHNVYVNDLGVRSLQQGRAYPDGTIFVFDLYDIRSAQGAIETRDRKFIGVMKKNAKLYASTGGWGWEVFKGYEETGSLQDMKQCFDCHSKQKRADYVFSTYTP